MLDEPEFTYEQETLEHDAEVVEIGIPLHR
jgi:hypothetical protein